MGTTAKGAYTVIGLLAELSELRAENKRLRSRCRWLEMSRAEWKLRAKGERWRSLRWPRNESA